MIPILYGATETAFTSNGLGRLVDATRCEVTEVRNGEYELELDYPLTGAKFDKLQLGTIISCIHDDRGDRQPFVIYQRTAPLDGIVTFNARHISYELGTVVAVPFSASSAVEALTGLRTNSVGVNRFTFTTDITTQAPFTVTEPMAVRSAMGGTEGSILDVYGGEYKYNVFAVSLLAHRGQNTGVTIRYGKNLTDLRHITDASESYNAVVPYWVQDNEDTGRILVMLPERIVTAAGVTDPVTVPLDLSQDFDEQPTEAQLRAAAQQHLADLQPWEPDVNLTLDFINLADTLEYEDVLNLQRLSLCDTVDVIYTALGVIAQNVQIIKVTYDVLAERYTKMELGTARSTYAQVLQAQTDAQIRDSLKSQEGFFTAAISVATDLLKGARGGHVRIVTDANGEPQEILVLDTDDLDTATNILRINLNGIGFSTDGGETYSTAWTINGHFVADFINSGTLRAIMIEGPTPETFWDLTSGRWQSTGSKTVTAEIGEGSDEQTTKTYSVKAVTSIDEGVMEIDGAVDGGTSQQLASIGVAAHGMGFTRYTDDPFNPERSDSFVYAGMDLHGSTVNGYASDSEGMAADIPEAQYRPHGVYSPDQIRLGEAEALNAASSDYVADRNPLILTGGWANAQDAIIFRRYYREYVQGDIVYAIPTASRYPRTVGGMTITKTSAGNGLYKYTIDGESPTEDTVIDYNLGMANATEATQCDNQEWLSDNGAPYWFITGSEYVEIQECSRLTSGGEIYTDYSLSYGLAEAVTDSPLGSMYNWIRLMVKAGAPLPLEVTPEIYDSGIYGLVKAFYPTPIDVRPAWEYAPGDTETGKQINLAALYTNGRKDLRFFLPLSRPISKEVTAVDFHCVLRSVYVNGTAVHNAAQNVPDDTEGYTLASVIPAPGGLTIWIRRATAWSNGTNNAAAMIQLTSWSATFLKEETE